MRFANAFYFEIYFQSISITVLPQNSQVAARVAIVIAMQNSPCSANGGHMVHGLDSNLGPTALPATISLDVSAVHFKKPNNEAKRTNLATGFISPNACSL